MARAMFEPVFKENFPFWEGITEAEKDHICNNTYALSYPKGTTIHDGTECSGVFFVRKGCLRVYMMSEEGRVVTLYRLHAGDMCMYDGHIEKLKDIDIAFLPINGRDYCRTHNDIIFVCLIASRC